MKGCERSIQVMTDRIVAVLEGCGPTIYLYGSLVLNDFKPGWSDIDILVLTRRSISREQAEQLVGLRQTMLTEEPQNPHYRSFEGGMLSLNGFLHDRPDTVVYWGSSGQRITERYQLNSFCMAELLEYGVLLFGEDVRGLLTPPSYEELRADVRSHYEAIRQHGGTTGRSLYSFGWLLDISRCLYTLRTGKIIAKTAAAEWALKEGLCPAPEALERALEVRREPLLYKEDKSVFDYAETLDSTIQRYADVLEEALRHAGDT